METLGGLGLRTNLPCAASAVAASYLQTTTLVPGCSLTGGQLTSSDVEERTPRQNQL